MKKIYSLLLALLFISAFGLSANTQSYASFNNELEQIYLFDSDITVNTDGTITVVETITLQANHQKIRRGIYRDIPFSFSESVTPLSLEMDGKPHPFFTESKQSVRRVNFGNNDFIPRGQHTYTFTYTFTGAIDFYKKYDELYWNVTGNEWDFTIDKARVHISFPAQVRVQQNGISRYTGFKGSQANYTEKTGYLTYETTRPLHPREGFTIAIPFDKGVIQKPSIFQSLRTFISPASIIALILLAALLIYFITTWMAVGIDPSYLVVPQYEPPQGISPMFMRYLCEQNLDTTTLACGLLSLVMKGNIEINASPEQGSTAESVFKQLGIMSHVKSRDTQHLSADEILLLDLLFPKPTDTVELGLKIASQWKTITEQLKKHLKQAAQFYVISNTAYIRKAVIGVILLGIVPFLLLGQMGPVFLFLNLHFSACFLLVPMMVSNLIPKNIFRLVIVLFYSMFWVSICLRTNNPAAWICVASYVLGIWGIFLYIPLIRNVTEPGRLLFSHIYGFKKYMKTAEINRVYASDPTQAEQIFCAFLPFAFSFGFENQWMKKFEGILPKATLNACTAPAVGIRSITHKLSSHSRGGGSHGGGHAGGGHGGGGGGGR